MLNTPEKLKEADLGIKARQEVREMLARIPFLGPAEIVVEPAVIDRSWRPDFSIRVPSNDDQWTLICEVKASGQPRHVRLAVLELNDYVRALPIGHAYPVLVAPYLSPEAREMCREANVGFLDFWGNWYLCFDQVFIERTGKKVATAQRRELRSLFGPKSARILRLLLRHPEHNWKVVELAERARVSVGQVSNVRAALMDHEWAEAGKASEGLRVTRPDVILDAWREVYGKHRPQRSNYYTLLHGDALESAIRAALTEADDGAKAVLASFSAAQWLAPFARVATRRFFADAEGEAALRKHLRLEPISRGENVVIERPKDEGIFDDRIQPAPGIWCTGLVQTYLDLAVAGERGREAAEHLRSLKILPMWKAHI